MFISSLIFASYYFHAKNGDNFQLTAAAYPFIYNIILVFGVPTKCKELILITVDTMKGCIRTYNYNAKQCSKSQMNR